MYICGIQSALCSTVYTLCMKLTSFDAPASVRAGEIIALALLTRKLRLLVVK